jgi:hypothetical protein
LSERLNICQEAVDYFRASSSILKAGVKAGLTLYDIAVLCCRNDDQAQVPSMLEKLLDMASDLAYIAIENDRWHHTAASRALVEQLTPSIQRRSSVACGLGSKTWVAKTASIAEFSSLRKHTPVQGMITSTSGLLESESLPPGMAQSSASSNSSVEATDTQDEEEEKEECEEWAASIILDVSVDQLAAAGRGQRSDSVSSDGSTESEQRGFWHVRPNSSPVLSEDVSVSWDTNDQDESFSDSGINGPDAAARSFKVATVTFADDVQLERGARSPSDAPRPSWANSRRPSLHGSHGVSLTDTKRPSTMSFGEFWTTDDAVPAIPPRLERSESGMGRSKSYSALSVVHGGFLSKKQIVSSELLTEEHRLYRNYFHSFIELVIARETTAALHNSKHAGVDILAPQK